MEMAPGMMVSTNVRLTRPLGEGAMGCVWVAEHLTLRTEVAVKFISSHLAAGDPEILARFVQEAATAAQIKSPHVVQTFDQGVMLDGTPYIVMELLEGETLQERLDRAGRLSLAHAAQVITQMARVLSKAHGLGIVHRDIKPDNIFVTPTEDGFFCKVLDFGIAKQTQLPKLGGLTNPGVMVGTPEYMSPEQVLSAKDVDFRADLWALAITMYHAITGRPPFTAEALGTLCVKLLDGRFKPASELRRDLNAGFDAWFLKALAHDPDDRFANVRIMARDFVALVAAVDNSVSDEISMSGVATVPGLDAPEGVLQAAGGDGLAQPTGAAITPTQAGGLGTLTGSSSNRHQEGATGGGWRIAAAVGVAIAALAVGASLALIGRSTGEPDKTPAANAESTPQQIDDHPSAASPGEQATAGNSTGTAAGSPPPSSTAADADPTSTSAPSSSSGQSPTGKWQSPRPKPSSAPANGSGNPRHYNHGF